MCVCRENAVCGTADATPTGLRAGWKNGRRNQGQDSGDRIGTHTESAQSQCGVSSVIAIKEKNKFSMSSTLCTTNGRT